MEHLPYPKILRVPDPSLTSPNGVWVATEKIHGANLVVGCDGVDVRIGKRKAWLDNGEPFFGWQLLRVELAAAARAIHAELGARVVRLYGELFGGAYPHESVPPTPGLSAVQTGIWYSPDLHYSVFDILIEDGEGEGRVRELLAHSEVERLAQSHGLLVAPLIARGLRSVIDAVPTRMLSRVPFAFGLPPLEGNVGEGLVVKPDVRCAPRDRFVIKRKIPEFDDARFDEATPFESDALLDRDQLAEHASRLVNGARLASARSKVGTDPRAIRDEVVLDVLVDLEAAFPAAFRALDVEAESELRAAIEALV